MNSKISMLCLTSGLLLASSCGKNNGNGAPNSGGSGNVNIKLKSAAKTSLMLAADGVGCGAPGASNGSSGGSGSGGSCYTPTAIRGHFNSLQVSGARLMGGGNKYHGLEEVVRTGYFDLAKPLLLDGDDNIQDKRESPFNILDLGVQSIEYQFLAAGKYFNVRIPLVTLPIAEDPQFKGCIDEGGLGEAAKYTKLYAEGISVTAGDILVCIKDGLSDLCKDSEYSWVEESGTLASTRPSSPMRLTGSYAYTKSKCSSGADHPDATWSSMAIHASHSSALGVTAAFGDAGKKIYTLNGKTGNTLDVVVEISMAQQLFVPSSVVSAYISTDYAAQGATILKNIDKVTLRQIYQYNTRTSTSQEIDGENMGTATLTATVSDKEEADDGSVTDLSTTLQPNN